MLSTRYHTQHPLSLRPPTSKSPTYTVTFSLKLYLPSCRVSVILPLLSSFASAPIPSHATKPMRHKLQSNSTPPPASVLPLSHLHPSSFSNTPHLQFVLFACLPFSAIKIHHILLCKKNGIGARTTSLPPTTKPAGSLPPRPITTTHHNTSMFFHPSLLTTHYLISTTHRNRCVLHRSHNLQPHLG